MILCVKKKYQESNCQCTGNTNIRQSNQQPRKAAHLVSSILVGLYVLFSIKAHMHILEGFLAQRTYYLSQLTLKTALELSPMSTTAV